MKIIKKGQFFYTTTTKLPTSFLTIATRTTPQLSTLFKHFLIKKKKQKGWWFYCSYNLISMVVHGSVQTKKFN